MAYLRHSPFIYYSCINLLFLFRSFFFLDLWFLLSCTRVFMDSQRWLANPLRFMRQFFKSLIVSGFSNLFFPYCRLKSLLLIFIVTATWWWRTLLINDILLNILNIHGWLSSAELQLVLLLGLPLKIHLWIISCYC